MAVSFDLFGTLVAVDRPSDPAGAIRRELAARDVGVPDDWADAYREPHASLDSGRERPLTAHVRDALASRGVEGPRDAVDAAVLAAFTEETTVETREGAVEAVATAATRGPVGVLSNCSVDGLVPWALERSALDVADLDAVVASVDCGWRKPDRRAFEALADALGVAPGDLTHVGDDPGTDGAITELGGEFVPAADLSTLADRWGSRA